MAETMTRIVLPEKEYEIVETDWVFHKVYSTDERFSRDYEFILVDCEKQGRADDGKV